MTISHTTLRRKTSLLAALPVLIAAGASAPRAAQASDQERVAIERFRGAQAQRLQGAFETGLLKRYYVVPDFTVEETARRKGVGLVEDTDFAQVGKALQVRGFVSAEVRRRGSWQVQLVIRRGDTGAAVGRFMVADKRLDRLESTLANRAPRRLAALLADRPEADGELRGRARTTPPALVPGESASSRVSTQRGGEVFSVRLGARMFNRAFIYTQNASGLPDYRLGGAFAGVLEAEIHPLIKLTPALAPLGIAGSMEYALGVSSGYADGGERHGSDVRAFAVALRWRLAGSTYELSPEIGYALQSFVTGTPGGSAPDVRYQLGTAGIDGRWSPHPRLAVTARAAYLHVISAGPMTDADRFSRATARGVSAEFGLSTPVVEALEVYFSAGIRRFGFAMNALPGDLHVAGGAIDQTTWLGMGVTYRPMVGGP